MRDGLHRENVRGARADLIATCEEKSQKTACAQSADEAPVVCVSKVRVLGVCDPH
jgi:hypothetical protein